MSAGITGEARDAAFSTAGPVPGSAPPWTWVAGGTVCGLAWAASLRGYMVELMGAESVFTWSGTFGAVLLPGVLAGGLLGWAAHLRRTGPPRGWRWLALAPLTFAIAPKCCCPARSPRS